MDKRYDKRTRKTRGRPQNGNTHQTTQKDTKMISNLQTPGHDGFWFNKFTSIHNRLALEIYRYLRDAQVPDWMTKGKTTLIQMDPSKGTAPNNYRPITCFTTMWKIFIAQIRQEIYYSLTSRRLFPDEQKGCRKWSRGTTESLYIDQHILNESKVRRKNLALAWIDNKKSYDMVLQSWIINSQNVQNITRNHELNRKKNMKNWRVELTVGGKNLAETKIQRGIFKEDAL